MQTTASHGWVLPNPVEAGRDVAKGRLLPRLNGRTMHDVVSKGNRDPEQDAALTIEDFCEVLVRWVVDVYHVTPHRGLHGETPKDAWDRLTARYGVRPPPSKQARILAFGHEETRVLQKTGLTFMNIRYHSDALAGLMLREGERSVTLRWHPNDIGTIMAFFDNEWHEVKSIERMFDGVSAATWEATCRSLRARHKANATVYADTVAAALNAIKEINERAVRRAGILVDYWTPERVAKMEDNLFIGFDLSRNAGQSTGMTVANDLDGFGCDLTNAADTVFDGNADLLGTAEEADTVEDAVPSEVFHADPLEATDAESDTPASGAEQARQHAGRSRPLHRPRRRRDTSGNTGPDIVFD